MPAIVETRHLVLRPWRPDDVAGFARLARDPRVTRYINGGEAVPDAEIEAFVARQLETQAQRGWSRWALELREPGAGEPTGVAGFCGPGCTFAPEVELGWWLDPDLWGCGLATEAGRAALDVCFSVVGFERVICVVHPDNVASLRVAEKVGFALEGPFEHRGMTLLKHAAHNPLPSPPRDPAFRRDCQGASTGTVGGAAQTTSAERRGPRSAQGR